MFSGTLYLTPVTEKQQQELAARVKNMTPGGQIQLKSQEERMALWGIVRSFRLGSVINFRVRTSANGDGSFTAVAIQNHEQE